MKRFAYLALTLVFLGAGCSQAQPAAQPTQTPAGQATQPTSQTAVDTSTKYSLDDVAKHATADDCWMAIDGKVYNVTSYVDQHPGGPAILKGCGKDATDMFNSVEKHAGKATGMLGEFQIGLLK